MRGKVVAIGVSVFIVAILIISALPGYRGWTQGQTWGYKWESNWKNSMQGYSKNVSFDGSIDGKTVNAFIVKYVGENNGMQRFHFEGSYYVYGYVKGKIKGNMGMMNGTGNIDMEIRSLWINYDGYFDLVKCKSEYFWENYTYYGMKDIKIHYYTKKMMDIYGKVEINVNTPNMSGELTTELKLAGTMDINSLITFNEPIPYLPTNDTPNYIYKDTYASYNGHWKINTNGYFKMYGKGSSGSSSSSSNFKTSFDKNIDKGFSGNMSVYASLERDGDYITRNGIIENIAPNFENIFPIGFFGSNDISFKNYMNAVTDESNSAKYDSNTEFYTSINLSSEESEYMMPDINGKGESSQSSESEVKGIEENAPAKYGSYSEGIIDLLMNYLLYIVIGIIAIIIIVVVLIVRRRQKTPV